MKVSDLIHAMYRRVGCYPREHLDIEEIAPLDLVEEHAESLQEEEGIDSAKAFLSRVESRMVSAILEIPEGD